MAQRTVVTLIDDLDGSEAAETIPFSFDGAHYEIELSADNAGQFRKVLRQYTDSARKITTGPPRRRRPYGLRVRNANIRAWAAGKGRNISARGRIPADVVAAYDAEHR